MTTVIPSIKVPHTSTILIDSIKMKIPFSFYCIAVRDFNLYVVLTQAYEGELANDLLQKQYEVEASEKRRISEAVAQAEV